MHEYVEDVITCLTGIKSNPIERLKPIKELEKQFKSLFYVAFVQ